MVKSIALLREANVRVFGVVSMPTNPPGRQGTLHCGQLKPPSSVLLASEPLCDTYRRAARACADMQSHVRACLDFLEYMLAHSCVDR
jgi:hypothetical protein